MSRYTGNPFTVSKSPQAVADRFADLTALQPLIDRLPEDQRNQLGQISFTPDTIVLNTQQVGNVTFRVAERTPQRITFAAEGTPMPLNMVVELREKAPDTTEAQCALDLDIPIFLKPMVAPHINKAMDMLTTLISHAL